MKKKKKNIKEIVKKSPIEITVIVLLVLGISVAGMPNNVNADNLFKASMNSENIALQIDAMQNNTLPFGSLPSARLRPPVKIMTVAVTAYNSVPWQTDSTPCIGAQGTDICEFLEQGSNTCAANFLPLGSKIEVEGLGTCVVRDRMNSRYWKRIDWYMGNDVASAKRFGIQRKEIGIYRS